MQYIKLRQYWYRNGMSLLIAQSGRPIVLFAERRVGKTFFLDNDLTPIAKRAGMLPVYADVWLQRTAPLDAVNRAREALLIKPDLLQKVWVLRKLLYGMDELEATEFLVDKLKATKNNGEFFDSMKK